MRLATLLITGAALLGIGGATLYLAASAGEQNVRLVEAVLADPAAHRHGPYVLMGVPQPREVPVTGPSGTELIPNVGYNESTVHATTWTRDGHTYYSVQTLTARDNGTALEWTLRNETRNLPADPEPALPVVTATFHLGASGDAFPVESFRGPRERIWAYYPKGVEHAMQPKPSQFTGHVLGSLPDGTPLPPGVLIFGVEEFTAGCSSKFLPPEAAAKYNVTA